MELKAQYDLDDLLGLIEQDLAAKGLRWVEGMEPDLFTTSGKLRLTLAIEQIQFKETPFVTEALPTPTTPPAAAPEQKTSGKKIRGVSKLGKTEEQLAKERVYRERYLEKKSRKQAEKVLKEAQEEATIQQHPEPQPTPEVKEVVAPTTVPFQFQQNQNQQFSSPSPNRNKTHKSKGEGTSKQIAEALELPNICMDCGITKPFRGFYPVFEDDDENLIKICWNCYDRRCEEDDARGKRKAS